MSSVHKQFENLALAAYGATGKSRDEIVAEFCKLHGISDDDVAAMQNLIGLAQAPSTAQPEAQLATLTNATHEWSISNTAVDQALNFEKKHDNGNQYIDSDVKVFVMTTVGTVNIGSSALCKAALNPDLFKEGVANVQAVLDALNKELVRLLFECKMNILNKVMPNYKPYIKTHSNPKAIAEAKELAEREADRAELETLRAKEAELAAKEAEHEALKAEFEAYRAAKEAGGAKSPPAKRRKTTKGKGKGKGKAATVDAHGSADEYDPHA